jgi:hypothetical protein
LRRVFRAFAVAQQFTTRHFSKAGIFSLNLLNL